MDTLLLFDIDGTLLHVAEDLAFARALRELFGDQVDLSWPANITVSDSSLVAAVVERALGRAPHDGEVAEALQRFVDHLDATIRSGETPVRHMPGAPAFIGARAAARTPMAIATGCVEPSARLKLRHAELAHLFPCGGYSHRERRRSDILARAIEAAEGHYRQRFAPDQIVSFGDGPWDVEAAADLGVRFIGINETEKGRECLLRAGATVVFGDFTDAATLPMLAMPDGRPG